MKFRRPSRRCWAPKNCLYSFPPKPEKNLLRAYRAFSQSLARSGPDEAEIKLDSEVTELPADRAVAVIGWENGFAGQVIEALSGYGVTVQERSVRVSRMDISRIGPFIRVHGAASEEPRSGDLSDRG